MQTLRWAVPDLLVGRQQLQGSLDWVCSRLIDASGLHPGETLVAGGIFYFSSQLGRDPVFLRSPRTYHFIFSLCTRSLGMHQVDPDYSTAQTQTQTANGWIQISGRSARTRSGLSTWKTTECGSGNQANTPTRSFWILPGPVGIFIEHIESTSDTKSCLSLRDPLQILLGPNIFWSMASLPTVRSLWSCLGPPRCQICPQTKTVDIPVLVDWTEDY